MRKNWLFVYLVAGLLLWLLLLQITTPGQHKRSPIYAAVDGAGGDFHFPVVFAPDITPTPLPTATPTPTATATATKVPQFSPLINGSFEDCIEGAQKCQWPTIPYPEPGWGNQPPLSGWTLSMVPTDENLFDSTDKATGVCECVHKEQPYDLPPNEWLGGPDALILEGKVVYKLFGKEAWGSELSQRVDLLPASKWRLTVPVQVHLHGDADPYAAESSVQVNGKPALSWANSLAMGDQKWCKHEITFTVPADGRVDISVRVKDKWQGKGKDFFIDDISLRPADEAAALPDMDLCLKGQTGLLKQRTPKSNQS